MGEPARGPAQRERPDVLGLARVAEDVAAGREGQAGHLVRDEAPEELDRPAREPAGSVDRDGHQASHRLGSDLVDQQVPAVRLPASPAHGGAQRVQDPAPPVGHPHVVRAPLEPAERDEAVDRVEAQHVQHPAPVPEDEAVLHLPARDVHQPDRRAAPLVHGHGLVVREVEIGREAGHLARHAAGPRHHVEPRLAAGGPHGEEQVCAVGAPRQPTDADGRIHDHARRAPRQGLHDHVAVAGRPPADHPALPADVGQPVAVARDGRGAGVAGEGEPGPRLPERRRLEEGARAEEAEDDAGQERRRDQPGPPPDAPRGGRRREPPGRDRSALERLGELGRAREPVGRQLLQRPVHRLGDVRRQPRPPGRDVARLLGDHRRDDGLRRGAGVRRVAAQHLVQHGAQGVDVAPRVYLPVAGRLLRAHVVRRAERQARLGEPRAPGLAHRQRDAEVGDQRGAVLQQDVLGLDVAVDHALPVRVVQRARDLPGQPHRLVNRELLLAVQPVAQGLSPHVRHDVEQQAVRAARVVQREDVRVLEVGGDADLVEEPLRADDGREVGPQDLHGDVALVAQVLAEIDRGHAALAQLPLDAVVLGEGRGQAVEVAHVVPRKIGVAGEGRLGGGIGSRLSLAAWSPAYAPRPLRPGRSRPRRRRRWRARSPSARRSPPAARGSPARAPAASASGSPP